MPTTLSMIVAIAENGIIGKAGDLPWRLPADLKRFKSRTMGKPILMGRKTHESIGRPLPGRRNLVLTSRPEQVHSECETFDQVDKMMSQLQTEDEVMVIGGGGLYRALLPQANRLYLTVVHAQPEGDTYFPQINASAWRVLEQNTFAADEKNHYAQTELVLERVGEGEDVDDASVFSVPPEWCLSHAD